MMQSEHYSLMLEFEGIPKVKYSTTIINFFFPRENSKEPRLQSLWATPFLQVRFAPLCTQLRQGQGSQLSPLSTQASWLWVLPARIVHPGNPIVTGLLRVPGKLGHVRSSRASRPWSPKLRRASPRSCGLPGGLGPSQRTWGLVVSPGGSWRLEVRTPATLDPWHLEARRRPDESRPAALHPGSPAHRKLAPANMGPFYNPLCDSQPTGRASCWNPHFPNPPSAASWNLRLEKLFFLFKGKVAQSPAARKWVFSPLSFSHGSLCACVCTRGSTV